MTLVRLEGTGLHSGRPCAVTLAAAPGPVVLQQGDRAAPIARLLVGRSDAGVTLTDGAGLRVDLVEHLLAALGGSGIREGVRIEVEGAELPLLDGGARRFVDALRALAGPTTRAGDPPGLRVLQSATLGWRDALYRFEPGTGVEVEAAIAFDHPAIGTQRAAWTGEAEDFAERIAPARTFGFLRDLPALLARERARGAASQRPEVLSAVLVFDDRGALPTGAPPRPDEPALHKLLDLVGDLYVYGGPPIGRVAAIRPGHTATHEVLRRALEQGIVGPACGSRSAPSFEP